MYVQFCAKMGSPWFAMGSYWGKTKPRAPGRFLDTSRASRIPASKISTIKKPLFHYLFISVSRVFPYKTPYQTIWWPLCYGFMKSIKVPMKRVMALLVCTLHWRWIHLHVICDSHSIGTRAHWSNITLPVRGYPAPVAVKSTVLSSDYYCCH